MANRVYSPFMLFNVRIVNMQHLWEPSREYKGAPTTKPNYFITCVLPKSRAAWWEEPLLAPAWAAYDQLLQKSGMTPQHVNEWPINDGDMPPEPGKQPSEWAKGHWILGGSSSSPIKVEMVQDGNVLPLPTKLGVKPGDYVALGCSAAIKQTNARGIKHFCNTVLFMAPGEEIAVGNSVSGAELMRTAQGQGLQIAGFSAPMGGGFGAPQGGFPGSQGAGPGSFVPQGGPGGFTPPQGPGGPGQGGFTPGGAAYAPMGGPAPSTAPSGPGFGGSAAFPSNQPQGAPGFTPPGGTFSPGMQHGQPSPGQMTTYPSNQQPGYGQPAGPGYPQQGQFPGR